MRPAQLQLRGAVVTDGALAALGTRLGALPAPLDGLLDGSYVVVAKLLPILMRRVTSTGELPALDGLLVALSDCPGVSDAGVGDLTAALPAALGDLR